MPRRSSRMLHSGSVQSTLSEQDMQASRGNLAGGASLRGMPSATLGSSPALPPLPHRPHFLGSPTAARHTPQPFGASPPSQPTSASVSPATAALAPAPSGGSHASGAADGQAGHSAVTLSGSGPFAASAAAMPAAQAAPQDGDVAMAEASPFLRPAGQGMQPQEQVAGAAMGQSIPAEEECILHYWEEKDPARYASYIKHLPPPPPAVGSIPPHSRRRVTFGSHLVLSCRPCTSYAPSTLL